VKTSSFSINIVENTWGDGGGVVVVSCTGDENSLLVGYLVI